jgi:hypothetical protein
MFIKSGPSWQCLPKVDALETGAVLLDVLSRLERRYRMPPLPNDLEEVRVAGSDVSVAFALEKARVALDGGTAPDTSLRSLFTTALAGLIKAALKPGAGDPAFQAMVLRSRSAEVDEFVTLAASHGADRRTVLSAVNAFAHPGKTGIHPATDVREVLSRLHGLASSGDWLALSALVGKLLLPTICGDELQRRILAALHEHPALLRLVRGRALRSNVDVQHYEALLAQQGTLAGSDAASKQGMASGRRGEEEEARAADALRALADALDRREPSPARHRVVTSLLVPAGFPGHSRHAKSGT